MTIIFLEKIKGIGNPKILARLALIKQKKMACFPVYPPILSDIFPPITSPKAGAVIEIIVKRIKTSFLEILSILII